MGTGTGVTAACARRFLLVVAVALALGACSKCDVPNLSWPNSGSAPAPASCHGDPPAP
jgi:hypothetical protein